MGCAPESGGEGVVRVRSALDRGGHVSLTNADNAQSLVDENCVVGNVVAAPIGTTVLDLLAHANGRRPELLHIGVPGGNWWSARNQWYSIGWWGISYWWHAKIPHILPVLYCM
jgi:hypothetical protein